MTQPRFLLLSTTTGPVTEVTWRLVAGNNHDLGRAPGGHPDVEAAREAVEELRLRLPALTSGLSPDSRPGRWGWVLREGTDVAAVSSRWYERQRESRYSLAQFLAAVPVAPVSASVLVRSRAREVRRAELRAPRRPAADDAGAPSGPVRVPTQTPAHDVARIVERTVERGVERGVEVVR